MMMLMLKHVRTNIGLAATLISSSFIYFIYIAGTGPCDSSQIILANHDYSYNTILNIKLWIKCSICSRPHYTDLTTMGDTGLCEPLRIIFGSGILTWLISLSIKFGVNRTFYVFKTRVYRFDLYERYRTL